MKKNFFEFLYKYYRLTKFFFKENYKGMRDYVFSRIENVRIYTVLFYRKFSYFYGKYLHHLVVSFFNFFFSYLTVVVIYILKSFLRIIKLFRYFKKKFLWKFFRVCSFSEIAGAVFTLVRVAFAKSLAMLKQFIINCFFVLKTNFFMIFNSLKIKVHIFLDYVFSFSEFWDTFMVQIMQPIWFILLIEDCVFRIARYMYNQYKKFKLFLDGLDKDK